FRTASRNFRNRRRARSKTPQFEFAIGPTGTFERTANFSGTFFRVLGPSSHSSRVIVSLADRPYGDPRGLPSRLVNILFSNTQRSESVAPITIGRHFARCSRELRISRSASWVIHFLN